MRRYFAILFLMVIPFPTMAQEFVFELIIKDTIGNADTVMLGYDLSATDSIDTFWEEQNILGSPYKAVLDVRASNHEWLSWNNQSPFETKKQIVGKNCPFSWADLALIEVDIKSITWPVKACWNKALFNASCDSGSVLTSVSPGGWWDTGGERFALSQYDSVILNQSMYRYFSGTDTLYQFWMAFGDLSLLSVGINEPTNSISEIFLFPNPAADRIKVFLPLSFGKPLKFQILTQNGAMIPVEVSSNEIDVSVFPPGIYQLTVINSKNERLYQKFTKVE